MTLEALKLLRRIHSAFPEPHPIDYDDTALRELRDLDFVDLYDLGQNGDARWTRIKRRKPGDQVDQQFLANVGVIVGGKTELPDQPARRNVGFMLDDLEIGRGDSELHRAVPRHRVLMTGRCPCSGLETCPEPLLNLSRSYRCLRGSQN